MMARDPRRNPKAGDVVIFGPQWQREVYHVLKADGTSVMYQLGPMRAVLKASLKNWREWAAMAEVIHVSE